MNSVNSHRISLLHPKLWALLGRKIQLNTFDEVLLFQRYFNASVGLMDAQSVLLIVRSRFQIDSLTLNANPIASMACNSTSAFPVTETTDVSNGERLNCNLDEGNGLNSTKGSRVPPEPSRIFHEVYDVRPFLLKRNELCLGLVQCVVSKSAGCTINPSANTGELGCRLEGIAETSQNRSGEDKEMQATSAPAPETPYNVSPNSVTPNSVSPNSASPNSGSITDCSISNCLFEIYLEVTS